METLPSTRPQAAPLQPSNMFFDANKFEHFQQVAKIFTTSTMVPEHFRGDRNIGNVMIALNFAARVEADPFMIMQNMYVVHGKPGIESKLAISLFNQTGRFSPLRFKYTAEKTECRAVAQDLRTGEDIEGPAVSMEMAQREGWSTKSGSKWKSMPELMLSYRAAMFFIRSTCPEVLLGMLSKDEIVDIKPIRREAVIVESEPDPIFKPLLSLIDGRDTDRLDEYINFIISETNSSTGMIISRAAKNFDAFWEKFQEWKNGPVEPEIVDPEPPKPSFRPTWTARNSEEKKTISKAKKTDDVKLTAAYQQLSNEEEMFPELYKLGVQKFGEPTTVERCGKTSNYIREMVDQQNAK